MSDIYKEEIFENCCVECGKTFETKDSDATLCTECWNRIVLLDSKEEGENITS